METWEASSLSPLTPSYCSCESWSEDSLMDEDRLRSDFFFFLSTRSSSRTCCTYAFFVVELTPLVDSLAVGFGDGIGAVVSPGNFTRFRQDITSCQSSLAVRNCKPYTLAAYFVDFIAAFNLTRRPPAHASIGLWRRRPAFSLPGVKF